MNLDKAIHVRRHPLWELGGPGHFRSWMLRCDLCDDDMEFASWADAQAGAGRHAKRHAEETCGTCGQTPWIRYSEWP